MEEAWQAKGDGDGEGERSKEVVVEVRDLTFIIYWRIVEVAKIGAQTRVERANA